LQVLARLAVGNHPCWRAYSGDSTYHRLIVGDDAYRQPTPSGAVTTTTDFIAAAVSTRSAIAGEHFGNLGDGVTPSVGTAVAPAGSFSSSTVCSLYLASCEDLPPPALHCCLIHSLGVGNAHDHRPPSRAYIFCGQHLPPLLAVAVRADSTGPLFLGGLRLHLPDCLPAGVAADGDCSKRRAGPSSRPVACLQSTTERTALGTASAVSNGVAKSEPLRPHRGRQPQVVGRVIRATALFVRRGDQQRLSPHSQGAIGRTTYHAIPPPIPSAS